MCTTREFNPDLTYKVNLYGVLQEAWVLEVLEGGFARVQFVDGTSRTVELSQISEEA